MILTPSLPSQWCSEASANLDSLLPVPSASLCAFKEPFRELLFRHNLFYSHAIKRDIANGPRQRMVRENKPFYSTLLPIFSFALEMWRRNIIHAEKIKRTSISLSPAVFCRKDVHGGGGEKFKYFWIPYLAQTFHWGLRHELWWLALFCFDILLRFFSTTTEFTIRRRLFLFAKCFPKTRKLEERIEWPIRGARNTISTAKHGSNMYENVRFKHCTLNGLQLWSARLRLV